jgi:ABC-type multidrug transport system ATPase subunit
VWRVVIGWTIFHGEKITMSALIECENLTKLYGGKQALKNVSFQCQAGDPIALVGPNGAGKTTLFSILCHYFSQSSGTVKLLGHNPGDRQLHGQVSALPQDAQFDPAFSVMKQLTFLAKLQGFNAQQAKQETMRVLGLMDLSQSMNALPSELSHGMRKRAAIAQALIGRPKLVLLDEPTAGLDPGNAKNIRQQISKLSGETTFLISSHNIQELERLCDTVLHLEQGELKQQINYRSNQQQDSAQSFITIEVEEVDKSLFINNISKMTSVANVLSENKNEFVIAYDGQTTPDFDQRLLKNLAEQNWRYRRLIKGQTLEEKLFS